MAGEVVRAAATLAAVLISSGIRGRAPENLLVSSSARIPRVVFHGVPTLEEATEATSELILGIENIFPSSTSNSEVEQATASVTGEITTEPAVPTTVSTAFRLLRESPVAQNAVASIASDPNVVRAVLENQQLQAFLHSERRQGLALSRSVTGAERHELSIEDPSNFADSRPLIRFEDLLRQTIMDIIQNVSDLFINLFGREGARSSANGYHGDPGASAEHVIESSLLGLAIMVLMLIFLRRL